MAYGQRPGQDGEQEQGRGNDGRSLPPQWGYGQPTARSQPVPPSQPGQPGQPGFGPPPPQPPYQPPRRGKSWPARHKALTGLLAFGALIIIIVAANAGKSPSSPGSSVAAVGTTTASATATGVHSQHATRPAAALSRSEDRGRS